MTREGRSWWYQQEPNSVSIARAGITNPQSTSGGAAYYTDTSGEYILHTTSNPAGSVAGWFGPNYSMVARQTKPIFTFTFFTGLNATEFQNVRTWVGLFSSDPSASPDPSGVHIMGFRYATTVDGTLFWRTVTKDGTTSTVTTTTVALIPATRYVLQIFANTPTQVDFWVNTDKISTHTTNLPGLSTYMGWQASWTNLVKNEPKTNGVARVHCENN